MFPLVIVFRFVFRSPHIPYKEARFERVADDVALTRKIVRDHVLEAANQLRLKERSIA